MINKFRIGILIFSLAVFFSQLYVCRFEQSDSNG